MISESQINYFKEFGIWYTGLPVLDRSQHVLALQSFLSRPESYKSAFLQTKLDTIFEGYSYLGQSDSVNQVSDDLLYTYVLSDFFDQARHPKEFASLFEGQKELIETISILERLLLSSIYPELLSFYDDKIGHSLSANYYPAGHESGVRLTAHPDGSLLTVFPFGMDQEFKYERPDGSWRTVEKTNEIICFSGYLLECLTDIKALNHKVEKPGPQSERFSFAYFSIPRPAESFLLNHETVSSEAFFARYLSLFD